MNPVQNDKSFKQGQVEDWNLLTAKVAYLAVGAEENLYDESEYAALEQGVGTGDSFAEEKTQDGAA
ncbi:MAG: hypothetical protein Q8807_03135 ['Waltheria sp.' little leaf phytoplasma]|nr:hypothetical protein ['Waltheria sp.' little leaf phytoplasma]